MRQKPWAAPGGQAATRRQFLRAALAGGGATLLTAAALRPAALAAGQADALLLSCMDYRLADETEHYMTRRGLRNRYDHVVLAGAALGVVTDKYPEWGKTFWDELGLAIDLHGVHKVMLLDHRDCGAYRQILGVDFARQPHEETEAHATQLRKLRGLIGEKYPRLEVELLLMNLGGRVETIPGGGGHG